MVVARHFHGVVQPIDRVPIRAGDVSGHTPSRRHPEYWDGDIPWIGIRDAKLHHGEVITDTEQTTNQLGIDNSSARLLPSGTICLSRTASVGYVVEMGRPMATSQDFVNWICSQRLDRQFLKHALLAEADALLRFGSGSVHKTIYYPEVKALHICLPPLSEQRRIVSVLNAAFAGLATAEANTRQNLTNTRELFEKCLNQAFIGIPDNSKRFGDVCDFVRGPFGGSLKKSMFVADGYAVYEQQHAIGDQFDSIRYRITQEKFESMKRFEIKPGDLIMSCSGTMGRVAIVPDSIERGIINQALLKISPRNVLKPDYLGWWMKSDTFFEQLGDRTKGVAIKNVASVKVLKEIALPVPSIECQSATVGRISELHQASEQLAASLERKLTALADLKQSLLHRAFRGELAGNEAAVQNEAMEIAGA